MPRKPCFLKDFKFKQCLSSIVQAILDDVWWDIPKLADSRDKPSRREVSTIQIFEFHSDQSDLGKFSLPNLSQKLQIENSKA